MASTPTGTKINVDALEDHLHEHKFNNILNNKDNAWQTKLQEILSQRRGIVDFREYKVSKEHNNRMQELADTFPDVFDNPSSTHRSKWFNHPKYAMNVQMPEFHVHFRQEMQSVLAHLAKAHQAARRSADGQEDHKGYLPSAFRTFRGCMQGLHGHVRIEERAYFPIFQNRYHHVDLGFLYEDHKHLHETESKLMNALNDLTTSTKADLEEKLVHTIQLALVFDQQLMTHLGEEEEIILPMSLALEGRLPM